jgi:hypothetical protein
MSLKTRIRGFLNPPGDPMLAPDAPPFKLFEYGTHGFDYEAYRKAQIKKAGSDTGDTWADEKTLDVIADYAKTHISPVQLVICHGSKGGMESRHLAKRLNCEAIGTDIAPPPGSDDVVEWDFHERSEEWAGRASVIYTNALDHSYDPKKAMDAWVDQLAPGGLIFIEHTMLHGPQGTSESDPFGAHPLIMPYLVLEWGAGHYCVTDIIKPPHKKPHWKPTNGVRPDTDLDIWVLVVAAKAS